jgi:hypothetical protein
MLSLTVFAVAARTIGKSPGAATLPDLARQPKDVASPDRRDGEDPFRRS